MFCYLNLKNCFKKKALVHFAQYEKLKNEVETICLSTTFRTNNPILFNCNTLVVKRNLFDQCLLVPVLTYILRL